MEYEQHFYGRSSYDPSCERSVSNRLGGSWGTPARIAAIFIAFVVVSLTAGAQRQEVAASADAALAHAGPVNRVSH